MAAPTKKGLDYYPRKTAFFKDPVLMAMQKSFGLTAICIYEAILDKIYEDKGYYYDLRGSGREELEVYLYTLFGWAEHLESGKVEEIINRLGERKFNKELFAKGIITNEEIQEIYYIATERRKAAKADKEIWLLEVKRMEELSKRSPILSLFKNEKINDDINSQSKVNQSKVNQTKVKKTKVNENTRPLAESNGVCGEKAVEEAYKKHFGGLTEGVGKKLGDMVSKIAPEVVTDIFEYSAEGGYGFPYAQAIIQRLIGAGTVTWELYRQRERAMAERHISHNMPKKTAFVNYNQPVYTEAEIEEAIRRKQEA